MHQISKSSSAWTLTQICVELLKITFLTYINQGIHTRS
uniref:Uncharacterized protein n=1 Tax=Arundo donax TaxID=35708 RepID=A0A0A9EYJ6_ARUDO